MIQRKQLQRTQNMIFHIVRMLILNVEFCIAWNEACPVFQRRQGEKMLSPNHIFCSLPFVSVWNDDIWRYLYFMKAAHRGRILSVQSVCQPCGTSMWNLQVENDLVYKWWTIWKARYRGKRKRSRLRWASNRYVHLDPCVAVALRLALFGGSTKTTWLILSDPWGSSTHIGSSAELCPTCSWQPSTPDFDSVNCWLIQDNSNDWLVTCSLQLNCFGQ